jgi:CRP/FNR family cyclic AMP-dependent transcriptional regulator
MAEKDKLVQVLMEHRFFQGMERRHVELMADCAANVTFQAGDYIAHAGEEAKAFFAIRRGRVALEIHVPGQGSLTIQTVGEGEVVGFSWLVSPYTTYFDVRAVQLTRAIAIHTWCLRNKCDEDPKLGYDLGKRFLEIVAQRLQATRLQLLDVYGHGPKA